MNALNALLIIDPQNDFCEPQGALFVPGAGEDMQRLAHFIRAARPVLGDILVTLDSHPGIAIERTTFWIRGDGEAVSPFTQISHAQVAAGEYRPRNMTLRDEALMYLQALEAQGRYRLIVWPVHCVVGAWGHNIQTDVFEAISGWEIEVQRGAFKVLKGQNPMTEQYSAVRAEVPVQDDPGTNDNGGLIDRLLHERGLLLIAGEASSHCVAATLEHLFEKMPPQQIERVAILSDCMSPVSGFERQASEFFEAARERGARILTSTEALMLL